MPLLTTRDPASGFTLIESAVVLVVFGLVLTFSIPAVSRLSESDRLKGAAQNLASELRLARQKAIATGQPQQMHFAANWPGCGAADYHIHNGAVVGPTWKLPRGISFESVGVDPRMEPNGRANAAGLLVLRDTRGQLDTVSVQLSGLVLVK